MLRVHNLGATHFWVCSSAPLPPSGETLGPSHLPLVLFRLLGVHAPSIQACLKELRVDCHSFSSHRDGLGPFSGPWRTVFHEGLFWGFSRPSESRTQAACPGPCILHTGSQPAASMFEIWLRCRENSLQTTVDSESRGHRIYCYLYFVCVHL